MRVTRLATLTLLFPHLGQCTISISHRLSHFSFHGHVTKISISAWSPLPRAYFGLATSVLWYTGTMTTITEDKRFVVERVQTGVRMEKRLLKVLKGFAEYRDMSLGDLLEGIVLHAFDGKCPFSDESLRRIKELKKFYGLDLDSSASHRLKETAAPPRASMARARKKAK